MFIFVLLSEDQARLQVSILQSGLLPFCGTKAALGKLKPRSCEIQEILTSSQPQLEATDKQLLNQYVKVLLT